MNRYRVLYGYRREVHVPVYLESVIVVDAENVRDAIAIAEIRASVLQFWVKDVEPLETVRSEKT